MMPRQQSWFREVSRRPCRAVVLSAIGGLCLVAMGCAAPPAAPPDGELREMATQYIRAAARFPDRPEVRAHAMEVAGKVLGSQSRLLLREGLSDGHPAVRFASCMVLGELADDDARPAIERLTQDADGSVRVAAYYALERMGDGSHRVAWRDALRHAPDVGVRRNAVTALGRLGNKTTIPLLWTAAAEDSDEGVRIQAIEALAFLGDSQAIGRLIYDAYGGLAFKQPFALLALGHVKDDRVLSTLRTRLNGAPYLEARLAAARSLGMQGYDDGYALALRALTWNEPNHELPDDPPENQVMRVRSMAALALGEIGRREALGSLAVLMRESDDPRVQVAAATAILVTLNDTSPEGDTAR